MRFFRFSCRTLLMWLAVATTRISPRFRRTSRNPRQYPKPAGNTGGKSHSNLLSRSSGPLHGKSSHRHESQSVEPADWRLRSAGQRWAGSAGRRRRQDVCVRAAEGAARRRSRHVTVQPPRARRRPLHRRLQPNADVPPALQKNKCRYPDALGVLWCTIFWFIAAWLWDLHSIVKAQKLYP